MMKQHLILVLGLVVTFICTFLCIPDAIFKCKFGPERPPLRDVYYDGHPSLKRKHTELLEKIHKEMSSSIVEHYKAHCYSYGDWDEERIPLGKFPSRLENATKIYLFCETPISDIDTTDLTLFENPNILIVNFQRCSLSDRTILSVSAFPSLTFLIVQNGKLQILDSVTILPDSNLKKLKWLDISSNEIVKISHTFLCSFRELMFLNVRYNNLKSDSFMNGKESTQNCTLKNLRWLDLSHNRLLSIPDVISRFLPNLEVFIATNNMITSIESTLFLLPQAQFIDLQKNNFSLFDFHFAPKSVRVLILNDNPQLRVIEDKYKISQKFKLQNFDITMNDLYLVNFHVNCCSTGTTNLSDTIIHNLLLLEEGNSRPMQTFNDVEEFITAHMEIHNAIIYKIIVGGSWSKDGNTTCVCEYETPCTNTRQITFTGQRTANLSFDEFEGKLISYCVCDTCHNESAYNYTKSYAALDMRWTSDEELRSKIIESDEKYRYNSAEYLLSSFSPVELNYSHSNIPYLKDSAFEDCGNIEVLDLRDNKLTEIRGPEFKGLTNLRKLFMQHNKISSIASGGFTEMPKLEVLSLAYNLLTTLSTNSFCGLNFLSLLKLHENRLEQMDADVFSCLSSLKTLTLHDNRLPVLYWDHFPPNLQVLTVANNCFPCDCNFLLPFRDFIMRSELVILDTNKTNCQQENGDVMPMPILEFTEEECETIPPLTKMDEILFWSLVGTGLFLAALVMMLIFWYIYRYEVKVWCYTRFGVRFGRHYNKLALKENDKRFDAYVSYSTADEEFVAHVLVKEIEKRNYRLCLQERNFLGGACIAEAVGQAIENSRRTIIVISPNFVQNNMCQFEFKLAHHDALKQGKKKLIVVLFQDVNHKELDVEIRSYLRTNTYLRWGCKMFWQKLFYALPTVPIGGNEEVTVV